MITLHNFNETHFLPTRRHTSERYHAQLQLAVKRLTEFLNREAQLSDLNDETLRRFEDSQNNSTHASRLYVIWRYAAKIGALPAPVYKPGSRYERVTDKPGQRSLQDYFDKVYLPARDDLKPETIKNYRQAVRHYVRFTLDRTGCRCQNITVPQLRAFRTWLLDTGVKAKAAANFATTIGAIVRHACPEKWLPTGNDSPDEQSGEHRLEAIYRNEYLKENMRVTCDETASRVSTALISYGRYLGHAPTLDDLTDESVGGWMRHLREQGLAIATINGYRSKILSLWTWCAKKRIADRFPTIKQFAEPEQTPTAWSQPDLRKLLAACESMAGDYDGVPASLWWKALHALSWDTGERTGALLDIRWEWIDVDEGSLVIPAEYRKGRCKAMHYQLKGPALRLLRAIEKPRRDKVFPFPWRRSTYFNRYKRLLKNAGLPYVPHKSGIQKMRRSFASHLEALGGNATTALRHESRQTTERSYIDPRIVKTEPANTRLFEL